MCTNFSTFSGCPDHTKPHHRNLMNVTHQEAYVATMNRVELLKKVEEVKDVIFIWVRVTKVFKKKSAFTHI